MICWRLRCFPHLILKVYCSRLRNKALLSFFLIVASVEIIYYFNANEFTIINVNKKIIESFKSLILLVVGFTIFLQ